ncbi:MAG: hypothetical protein ACE5HS_17985 [bacterium]
MRTFIILIISKFILSNFAPVIAQDNNIQFPIADIEQRLKYEPFDIFRKRDSRFKGDITKQMIIKWQDGVYMRVKWKRGPSKGQAVNNQPRYEIAAYQLQKLFLQPEYYVVPPTVARFFSIEKYREIEPNVKPTFKKIPCVLFVLQYWLENVTNKNIYDKKLFKTNEYYAMHLGNMNILSYLIKHSDSNVGNFLISTDPANLRVFAVDNGMAFNNIKSDRGYEWQDMRVKKLPAATVEKLRKITLQDLQKTLGVVAQFTFKGDNLVEVQHTENLDPKKGVRISNNVVQFGLTEFEIKGVHRRLQDLLKRVHKGKIKTF